MPASPNGFAMVPAWLAWKRIEIEDPRTKRIVVRGIEGNESLLYIHIAMAGRMNQGEATYENCLVSMKELAEGNPKTGYPGTGLSISTIRRAIRGLRAFGAVESEETTNPDGSEGPNKFRVIFGRVVGPETPAQPPPITGDTPSTGGTPRAFPGGTPGVSPVAPLEEEVKPIREEEPPPTPTVIDNGSASSPVPAQKRGGIESSTKHKSGKTADPAVAKLAAELHALAGKPGWTVEATAAALAAVLAEGRRTWPVIERVARWAAVDPGTDHPGRLVRGRLPAAVWMDAGRPAPVPKPTWCGCCDEQTRIADDLGGGRPGRCPSCHPLLVGVS